MTVEQLITVLKGEDPKLKVLFTYDDRVGMCDINCVERSASTGNIELRSENQDDYDYQHGKAENAADVLLFWQERE